MDVHAPHHAIGGWKDFFVHLVTITVGLLIAVGIEGCVELHREHSLVKEARQTLREEIEFNSKKMADAVPDIESEKGAMQENIHVLTRIFENPKDKDAQNGSINADFRLVGLHDTAWKTAQATGALAYMPYEESQKYADLYSAQQDYLKLQDKLMDDEVQFLGVMTKTDFGHGTITPEMASMALETFGVWREHLLYLGLMAKVSAATDKAFLEGKEAPTEMGERITK